MSSLKSVSSNVTWLSADRVVRLGLNALSWIIVMRVVGPEAFGRFSYVYAAYLMFVPVVAFGLDNVVVRWLIRAPDAAPSILGSGLALRLISAAVSWLALTVWVQSTQVAADGLSIAAVLGLGLIGPAFDVIDLEFQSRLASRWTVMAKALPFLLSVVLRILAVSTQAGFVALAAAVAIEPLLGALGLSVLAHRNGLPPLCYRVTRSMLVQLARESLPFLMGALAVVVYMRIDQIMLLPLCGPVELGLYAAAARLSELLYFAPMVLVTSLAPVLHRVREQDPALFQQRVGELLGGLATVGLMIAVALSVLAPLLVPLLLGAGYERSIPILAIHAWSLIFVFVGVGQSVWDTAEGQGRWVVVRTTLGAVANVGLNVWLLPGLGGVGAAIATLASYALSAWIANLLGEKTRPMFWLQLRSPLLFWTAVRRRYVGVL